MRVTPGTNKTSVSSVELPIGEELMHHVSAWQWDQTGQLSSDDMNDGSSQAFTEGNVTNSDILKKKTCVFFLIINSNKSDEWT